MTAPEQAPATVEGLMAELIEKLARQFEGVAYEVRDAGSRAPRVAEVSDSIRRAGHPIAREIATRLAAPPAPPQEPVELLTDAAKDVLAERERQISVEGWTPGHDDEHAAGDMALAAGKYASAASGWTSAGHWPWSQGDWKPGTPRRMLVKAGALILAEIERLDRAKKAGLLVKEAK